MPIDPSRPFTPVQIALLTVSDTRTLDTDTSGQWLVDAIAEAGHRLVQRTLLPDDMDVLVGQLAAWRDDPEVQVVISTGGTGITGRDITPEAFEQVITKAIPGFGELFRWLSYQTIGTSTVQSRALAGLASTTLMFALPGSRGAVKDAWNGILRDQLDSRHMPCNFVDLMPRFAER